MNAHGGSNMGENSMEAALLCIPEGYYCVDLSLYKVMSGTLSHVISHSL